MEKQHYYAFSFEGRNPVTRAQAAASVYLGYPQRDAISLPRIREAKREAGMASDAVVVSVTYLGHMTEHQFKNLL